MNVVFRADASLHIGTGHVVRCLTLAEELAAGGTHCAFISRDLPGNLLEAIRQRGFEAYGLSGEVRIAIPVDSNDGPLPSHAAWLDTDWFSDAAQSAAAIGDTRADWLIVDHYALDCRWERQLRPICGNLMVVDDLADRTHDCDLLLDQNLGRQARDYAQLVPDACKVLTGPDYALLRPEFAKLRDYSLRRRSVDQVKHILITMGGVDRPNATSRVLEALRHCPLPKDCRISVVMGPHAPWLEQVRALARHMPRTTEVRVDVRNMAQLMADADLAVGAAGGTAWERCCMGLPTLIVVLAANQQAGAAAVASTGSAVLLGGADDVGRTLGPALGWLAQAGHLQEMSRAARTVADGGGASRVVAALLEQSERD